jgi:iron complex outermembrane receptor protein
MIFGHSHRRALRLACSPLVIAAVFAATAPRAAQAQSVADSGAAASGTNINLGSVTATGNGSGEVANDALATTPGSAAAAAPSRTPFDAKQPTSVVSQKFIDNSVPPTGNYDDAIKDTPSVSNVEPNGPGLQESKTLSIRGFQDG